MTCWPFRSCPHEIEGGTDDDRLKIDLDCASGRLARWSAADSMRALLLIEAEKQIAHRLAYLKGEPSSPAMFGTIMQHVTTLAKGLQVARSVVGWVVIEMGGREKHARRAHIVIAGSPER